MSTHITRERLRYAPTDADDLYPETDGKPMAATDMHRRFLIWVLQVLEAHFANTQAYISGDIMMYYVISDTRNIAVSPDVLITFGIEQKARRVYRVSKRDNPAPDFVMEFTSKATHEDDVGRKMDIYAMIGIRNYFLYDAEGLYLPAPLMGFELVGDRYARISEGVDGGIHSSALNLDFHLRAEAGLGIYDPVLAEWLKTPAEAAALRADQETIERQAAEARADQESARADQEATRADQEATRADQETIERQAAEARADQEAARADQEAARADQETIERQAAEARADQEAITRQRAEAEAEQLREELERLRTRS